MAKKTVLRAACNSKLLPMSNEYQELLSRDESTGESIVFNAAPIEIEHHDLPVEPVTESPAIAGPTWQEEFEADINNADTLELIDVIRMQYVNEHRDDAEWIVDIAEKAQARLREQD